MGQNFPYLPSEVLPIANGFGFENAAITPDTSMAFAMEDFGTQPFAFEPEDASGLYGDQNFQDFYPEVLSAAAKAMADTIRPTNNPTHQAQADGSIQRQQMPKPFQCSYPGCNSKGFSRKYELQRHTKKHSRSQLFLCPVVGCHFHQLANAFYRHDKLGCHMRSCHPGVQIPPTNGQATPAQTGAQSSVTSSMGQNVPVQINMQG
ncbi:Wilms tumor protein-like protein B [Lasiodiplodia hormozganensis]|uniref:Wilms tumor protein-like protein B n=1 Tax=Lasiodiplodia hormozganensis TaxID=869390 RepID=A0AA39Z5A6_9PEZI|nr:Wilms tumor protein-like protein B [Lasiodiplodia hormozganensis]